jgi:AcrR family transcriptional regulator
MADTSSRSRRRAAFYIAPDDAPGKVKILTVALALFVRDGLCETSVRDIAKASGFTNPALFKHFPTKDALARYLFERCYLELAQLVASAIASHPTFAARQRAIVDEYLGALERDADSVLYVQDYLRQFWPKLPAAVRRHSIIGSVRRLLEDGRAEGVVSRDADLGLMTVAWIGGVQQIARARFFGELPQHIDVLAGELDALLTKLVHP